MDQVHVVRHKLRVEGRPIWSVAREMGIARNTLKHYLEHLVPVRLEAEPRARSVWNKLAERCSSCSRSRGSGPTVSSA
jgi:hypothetical protein